MARLSRAQGSNELRRLRLARYERYLRDGCKWVRWTALENAECTESCRAMNTRVVSIDDQAWPQLLRTHTSCGCRFTLLLDHEAERLHLE